MLAAAVASFAAYGFHDASMDDIAARAGVSKPMVYAYLGSKEELFVACMHHEGTRLMQAIVDVVDPTLQPEQQMHRGMRAFFSYVATHPDGWTVLHRRASAAFASEYGLMRARMTEVVESMLRRAVSRAVSQAGIDVATLAYALVGAGESLADWLVEHPSTSPDALAARCMGIVWLGVGNLLNGVTWGGSSGGSPANPQPASS
jgi:AcrR family transcriptional regulator